jgi:hypothetical protein
MSARRAAVPALAFLLLSLPGQASQVEEATGGELAYQFDAGTHHDAPDACADASAAWSVPLGGSAEGMLVAGDDEADHFVLDIPTAAVGTRVQVTLSEAAGAPDSDLDVFAPSCLGDVFAAANLPAPLPRPPAPAAGEVQVEPSNLNGPFGGCAEEGWVFSVSGLQEPAPASIHVAWTDGTEAGVALSWSTPGLALYATGMNPNTTLKGAWGNLPSGWSGEFRVAFSTCNLQHGGAVYGLPPLRGDDLIQFTPVRSGAHVVRATLAEPEPEPPGPTSVPASCHYCLGVGEQASKNVSYRLVAVQV